MFEHKFTDDEIIRALECCTNCICNHAKTDTECPLVKMDFCKNYLMKLSLDLINRQKAEIEDLEIKNEHLVCFLAEARRDAIKEVFAKLRANEIKPEFPWDDFYITDSQLEEIEKEMTEEKR